MTEKLKQLLSLNCTMHLHILCSSIIIVKWIVSWSFRKWYFSMWMCVSEYVFFVAYLLSAFNYVSDSLQRILLFILNSQCSIKYFVWIIQMKFRNIHHHHYTLSLSFSFFVHYTLTNANSNIYAYFRYNCSIWSCCKRILFIPLSMAFTMLQEISSFTNWKCIQGQMPTLKYSICM